MTPLINELIKFAPEPEAFMWFDVGSFSTKTDRRVPLDVIMNPPFPRTALCGIDALKNKLAICLIAGENSVTAAGFRIDPFKLFRPFVYVATESGLRYYVGNEEVDEDWIEPAFMMVVVALLRVHEAGVAHRAVASKSLINKKRAAKGKPPLTFDWHTVKIEPSQAKGPYLGGTHASPRLHDRRGHWRKLANGKTCWVKACKVGDASKGIVFKDYEVSHD